MKANFLLRKATVAGRNITQFALVYPAGVSEVNQQREILVPFKASRMNQIGNFCPTFPPASPASRSSNDFDTPCLTSDPASRSLSPAKLEINSIASRQVAFFQRSIDSLN